jgi:hypothetical protein
MSLLSNLIIFNKLLQTPNDAKWKPWSVWLESYWVKGVPSPSLVVEYAEKHNIPLPEVFKQLLKTYERKGVKDNLQLLPMEKPDLSMDLMTRIAQSMWYFLMLYDFNAVQQLIQRRISNDEARTAVMSHLREAADFMSTEKYSYTSVADHFIPIVKNYFVSALTHWKEWITPEDLGLDITEIIQLIPESSGNPTDNPQSLYNQLMQNQLKWAEKSRCTDPGVKKGTKRLETNGSSDESPKEEPEKNDKKITITEAAQKLGLTRQRVHQLIQKGLLMHENDNHSKKILIREEDVLRFKDQKKIILPEGKVLIRRNHSKKNEKGES